MWGNWASTQCGSVSGRVEVGNGSGSQRKDKSTVYGWNAESMSITQCCLQKGAGENSFLSLLELSNVISLVAPARDYIGPVTEENAYNRRVYNNNAGASDSKEHKELEQGLPSFDSQIAAKERNIVAELKIFTEGANASPARDATVPEFLQQLEECKMSCYSVPAGWKLQGAPNDWHANAPKITAGETSFFDDVDNPVQCLNRLTCQNSNQKAAIIYTMPH